MNEQQKERNPRNKRIDLKTKQEQPSEQLRNGNEFQVIEMPFQQFIDFQLNFVQWKLFLDFDVRNFT